MLRFASSDAVFADCPTALRTLSTMEPQGSTPGISLMGERILPNCKTFWAALFPFSDIEACIPIAAANSMMNPSMTLSIDDISHGLKSTIIGFGLFLLRISLTRLIHDVLPSPHLASIPMTMDGA